MRGAQTQRVAALVIFGATGDLAKRILRGSSTYPPGGMPDWVRPASIEII